MTVQQQYGLRADNTSGFTGVSWHTHSGRWRAYIKRNGRSVHLGLYDTAEEAADAAEAAALAMHGPHAWTNTRRTP